MRVLRLWRYPVKTMLGEAIDAAAVGTAGIAGDRRLKVCDAGTGEPVMTGAAHGTRELWACRAQLDGDVPRVTLPEGRDVTGDDIAPALSELLGRDVVLREADGGAGHVFDSGAHHTAPLHVVTTGTLARLDADERRLRPNVVLDADDAFAEDRLVGGTLRGPGGVEIAVVLPTPRCAVPTRARDGLAARPTLLKEIATANRVDLGPFGRQPCAGIYAEVARAGRIAVGDELEATRATTPERVALDLALARLDPGATQPPRTGP